MRINIRHISLGGAVFLIHFSCVAVVFLLPGLYPQPAASITDGYHWYWAFLQLCEQIFFWLTFPLSHFMSHPRDGGLFLCGYPVDERTFVPFCIIVALNSLFIGYTIQLLVWIVRSRLRAGRHVMRTV